MQWSPSCRIAVILVIRKQPRIRQNRLDEMKVTTVRSYVEGVSVVGEWRKHDRAFLGKYDEYVGCAGF
jgi:hypothetical protein